MCPIRNRHGRTDRAFDGSSWRERRRQVFDGAIRCVLERNQRKMKKKKGKKNCVIS
ncbi:unnamed protein product [Ectocarpus sp. 12 AP-2014]